MTKFPTPVDPTGGSEKRMKNLVDIPAALNVENPDDCVNLLHVRFPGTNTAEERCSLSNGYMGIIISDKWDMPSLLPPEKLGGPKSVLTKMGGKILGPLGKRFGGFGGNGKTARGRSDNPQSKYYAKIATTQSSSEVEREDRLLVPWILTPSAEAYGVNQEDWRWQVRYGMRPSRDASANWKVPQGRGLFMGFFIGIWGFFIGISIGICRVFSFVSSIHEQGTAN